MTQVPGGGVSGSRYELDQPLGSFCAPPRTGHTCDPGKGEPALPPMPQMRHVCPATGSQCPEILHRTVTVGVREEILPTGS